MWPKVGSNCTQHLVQSYARPSRGTSSGGAIEAAAIKGGGGAKFSATAGVAFLTAFDKSRDWLVAEPRMLCICTTTLFLHEYLTNSSTQLAGVFFGDQDDDLVGSERKRSL